MNETKKLIIKVQKRISYYIKTVTRRKRKFYLYWQRELNFVLFSEYLISLNWRSSNHEYCASRRQMFFQVWSFNEKL